MKLYILLFLTLTIQFCYCQSKAEHKHEYRHESEHKHEHKHESEHKPVHKHNYGHKADWNFSDIAEVLEKSSCLKARTEIRIFRYNSAFSALKEELLSETFESFINTENKNYFIPTPGKIKSISPSFQSSYPVFIRNEYEQEQKIIAAEQEVLRKKLPPISRQPHAYQLSPKDKKIPIRRSSYLKAIKTEDENTIIYIFPDHLSIKEQFPHLQFITHEIKDGTQRYSLNWKILFYNKTENCEQNQIAKPSPLPPRKKLHPPAYKFPYQ